MQEIKAGRDNVAAKDTGKLATAQDGDDGKTRHEKNRGIRLPEKDPTGGARGHANAARASKKRGRGLVRGARQGYLNVENDMARVRLGIRQPVTSLWQTETDRAMTAPARRPPSAESDGAHNAEYKLSQRRPHSHVGQARGGRARLSVTGIAGTGVGDDEAPGEGRGGVAATADRFNKGEGRGRVSKDGDNSVRLAPVQGSEEWMANGDSLAVRVPMPLRSSHRVGPVGNLGERGRFYSVWGIL